MQMSYTHTYVYACAHIYKEQKNSPNSTNLNNTTPSTSTPLRKISVEHSPSSLTHLSECPPPEERA